MRLFKVEKLCVLQVLLLYLLVLLSMDEWRFPGFFVDLSGLAHLIPNGRRNYVILGLFDLVLKTFAI
jgi:hypothetical protein